jgi:hypothetical protein
MIATKQSQQERIHELRTEIDKLDAFVNSANNPDYGHLLRQHKAILNRRLYALRQLMQVLNEEIYFLN